MAWYPELLQFSWVDLFGCSRKFPQGCGHLWPCRGPRQCTWAGRGVSKTDVGDSPHEEDSGWEQGLCLHGSFASHCCDRERCLHTGSCDELFSTLTDEERVYHHPCSHPQAKRWVWLLQHREWRGAFPHTGSAGSHHTGLDSCKQFWALQGFVSSPGALDTRDVLDALLVLFLKQTELYPDCSDGCTFLCWI